MKQIMRIIAKKGNPGIIYDLWKVADDVVNRTDASKPFMQRYTFNGKQYVLVNATKNIISAVYTNTEGLASKLKKEFSDINRSKVIYVSEYEANDGKGTVRLDVRETAAIFLFGDKNAK